MRRWKVLAGAVLACHSLFGAPAAANDTTTCQREPASIIGTHSNDSRRGTPGADVATMRGGSDDFWGFAGEDLICGGSGNDHILPGGGVDHVYAGPGRDVVVSDIHSAEDRFYGGTGADNIWGGSGQEVILGGDDDDTLRAGRGTDELHGWTGDDLLKASLNDGAADYVEGGPGHDICQIRPEDTPVRCENVVVESGNRSAAFTR